MALYLLGLDITVRSSYQGDLIADQVPRSELGIVPVDGHRSSVE